MAEQGAGSADKPGPAVRISEKQPPGNSQAEKPESRKPETGKRETGKPSAHKKEEPKRPPPERNPVEQWLDAYLEATMGAASARRFEGTMEVTDYIPQIRVKLERKQPPLLGSPGMALAGVLLGLIGGLSSWYWLPPGSVARAVGLLIFALLVGFTVARLLWPPVMRLQMDALLNRLQWWNIRGGMKEITFLGCRWIDLVEQRLPGGVRYRISVEPRWGPTIPIAATRPGQRQEALLNAVELLRSMVKVTHLPVRVRVSRLAGGQPELPPLPESKPRAAGEEA